LEEEECFLSLPYPCRLALLLLPLLLLLRNEFLHSGIPSFLQGKALSQLADQLLQSISHCCCQTQDT
jgi:hypothetical protein